MSAVEGGEPHPSGQPLPPADHDRMIPGTNIVRTDENQSLTRDDTRLKEDFDWARNQADPNITAGISYDEHFQERRDIRERFDRMRETYDQLVREGKTFQEQRRDAEQRGEMPPRPFGNLSSVLLDQTIVQYGQFRAELISAYSDAGNERRFFDQEQLDQMRQEYDNALDQLHAERNWRELQALRERNDEYQRALAEILQRMEADRTSRGF